MDKSASRSQAVQKTRPRLAGAETSDGADAPSPSPLWQHLHLGLTALLALVAAVLVGLLVAGKLRFGEAAAAPEEKKGPETAKPIEKGGRYQVEIKEELQTLVGQAGKLDFFGERIAEAQVFKYKGGFLEVWLEAETYGNPQRGASVPQEWARLLESEQGLRDGDLEALVKEGHVMVAAMRPLMPVGEAMEPYHQHLGGFFVAGPAGPLHQLTTVHLTSSHWQMYRILVNSGPPTGKRGGGFNLWTGQVVNVRLPLIPRDLSSEEIKLGGGTDLTPDTEVTLMDRQRGISRIRLKARFLSDDAVNKAAKK